MPERRITKQDRSSHESRARWRQVRAAFEHALNLTEAEQAAYVAGHCEGEVATQVISLLEHHRAATDFLAPVARESIQAEFTLSANALIDVENLSGTELCGRYEIGAQIGRGGTACVYEATDRLSGETVALKVRAAVRGAGWDLLHQEATALRLLRLPGVVDLLDEGIEAGISFLAMERIHGTPFPGRPAIGPQPWPAIRDATLSLIEVVARVHWAGIAHCDLKPSNVLVRADKTCVVLDLGIAQDPVSNEETRQFLALAGTPRYTAPEQLLGHPGTARSDLYAIGVMLYEALAGRDPHDARDASEVICFRPNVPPPPLREVAAQVPVYVAELVDQLIAASPTDRPASAAEVLERLQREEGDGPDLPSYLGSRDAIDALVAAGRTGASHDIHGAAGSGKTSTLRAAAEALDQAGHAVEWTRASASPFGSLEFLFRPPFDIDPQTSSEASSQFRAALGSTLRAGTIVLADSAEQLDERSAALLDELRAEGSVIRSFHTAHANSTPLSPLTDDDLASLFLGHERVHHIPTDAAAELRKRSHGLPGATKRELAAWERAGIARREGDRVSISRADLERLRSGLRIRPAEHQPEIHSSHEAAELIACVDVLGRHATVARCAAVLQMRPWQTEAILTELLTQGVLYLTPAETLRCSHPTLGEAHWSPEERIAMHARVADSLPEHESSRFYHLIKSGRSDLAAQACLGIARGSLEAGRTSQASAILREGVWTMRSANNPDSELPLLELLLRCSLHTGTEAALDQMLYILGRAPYLSSDIRALQQIARSAHLALQRDTLRALGFLPRMTAEMKPEMLHSVLSIRMFLVRQLEVTHAQRIIAETEEFVANRGHEGLSDLVLTAKAWLTYAREDCAEAARLHAEVAADAANPLQRLASVLNCASAWLEEGEHTQAVEIAREAQKLAAAGRHVHHEARAERILRAAAYRRGDDLTPDSELVEAVMALGVPHLHALVCLNEAAVAWRNGKRGQANELAGRCEAIWRGVGHRWASLLARSLQIATGTELTDEGLGALVDAVDECEIPRIAAQAAHLLSLNTSCHTSALRELAMANASQVPRTEWHKRLEIVSILEAVQ